MNIETANRLLQYRKENNLSQEELAEKIGVSRQAVSKWERKKHIPQPVYHIHRPASSKRIFRMKIQTTSARTGFPLRTVSTLTAKTAIRFISHLRTV